MKQSEKLLMDAEGTRKVIDAHDRDIDLRAGQIDRLQQEIDSFKDLKRKEEMKYDDLMKQVEQEQAKEHDQEKREKQQRAIDIARSMAASDD